MEDLVHLVFWHWLIIGTVLLIIELISGSGFFFWTGLAAGLSSLVVWIFPDLNWMLQALFFAATALLFAGGWWFYLGQRPAETDQPKLNRRAEQLIGRQFTLTAAVVNGRGFLHAGDSQWRVRCAVDLPVGTKVRVTGVEGVVLVVEEV